MHNPKITVIIPTRERADVLQAALQTVTSQDYDNLEILVSDNAGRDTTKELVFGTGDKRVRWEFALNHVSDGWVTIIGDDDGLLPGAIRAVAEVIRSTDVDAIRSKVCSYYWPSSTGEKFGRLSIPLGVGSEIRKSRVWLKRVISGLSSYGELPMLYNGGYINVTALQTLRSNTGEVYRSCIPDVYSAVALASVLDHYVYLHEPTAINGASKHSTGTSTFAAKDGQVDGSPAAEFVAEGNMPFHADVPLCADGTYPPSIQALVLESYLQSAILRSFSDRPVYAEQLRNILATSGNRAKEINAWGKIFAKQHSLDFTKIKLASRVTRIHRNAQGLIRQFSRELTSLALGSSELPITNVHDASIVAGKTLLARPSIFRIYWRLASRILEKSFAKLK
jgi:glycosyltransferase involved in cell wall biosynthesis